MTTFDSDDATVRESINDALEHLNQFDSEQMTESERHLAAAIRGVAVAVMRTPHLSNPDD